MCRDWLMDEQWRSVLWWNDATVIEMFHYSIVRARLEYVLVHWCRCISDQIMLHWVFVRARMKGTVTDVTVIQDLSINYNICCIWWISGFFCIFKYSKEKITAQPIIALSYYLFDNTDLTSVNILVEKRNTKNMYHLHDALTNWLLYVTCIQFSHTVRKITEWYFMNCKYGMKLTLINQGRKKFLASFFLNLLQTCTFFCLFFSLLNFNYVPDFLLHLQHFTSLTVLLSVSDVVNTVL